MYLEWKDVNMFTEITIMQGKIWLWMYFLFHKHYFSSYLVVVLSQTKISVFPCLNIIPIFHENW